MKIEVDFNYDPGDRSVGLPGGWDECTFSVEDDAGEIRFVLGFEPGECDVKDWDVNYRATELLREDSERVKWTALSVQDDPDNFSTLYVEAPWAVALIEAQWRVLNLQEGAGESGLEIAAIESEISRIQWEREERGEQLAENEVDADEVALAAQLTEAKIEAERSEEALSMALRERDRLMQEFSLTAVEA